MYNIETLPPDGVIGELVTKESGNVSEAVGLVSMDGFVVVGKRFFEKVLPKPVELAEALADVAVELRIGSLLRTTFHNHRDQFRFLAGGQRDFHQLVTAFLKVDRRHDCEVDCTT